MIFLWKRLKSYEWKTVDEQKYTWVTRDQNYDSIQRKASIENEKGYQS